LDENDTERIQLKENENKMRR